MWPGGADRGWAFWNAGGRAPKATVAYQQAYRDLHETAEDSR